MVAYYTVPYYIKYDIETSVLNDLIIDNYPMSLSQQESKTRTTKFYKQINPIFIFHFVIRYIFIFNAPTALKKLTMPI